MMRITPSQFQSRQESELAENFERGEVAYEFGNLKTEYNEMRNVFKFRDTYISFNRFPLNIQTEIRANNEKFQVWDKLDLRKFENDPIDIKVRLHKNG